MYAIGICLHSLLLCTCEYLHHCYMSQQLSHFRGHYAILCLRASALSALDYLRALPDNICILVVGLIIKISTAPLINCRWAAFLSRTMVATSINSWHQNSSKLSSNVVTLARCK